MAPTDFETALDAADEIVLTTTGRVSGQLTSRPVWYVRQAGSLFLLPVTGTRSQWYRNLLKTPVILLSAAGSQLTATATPLTEPDTVADVVQSFRAKYGAKEIARYYSNPDAAIKVSLTFTAGRPGPGR